MFDRQSRLMVDPAVEWEARRGEGVDRGCGDRWTDPRLLAAPSRASAHVGRTRAQLRSGGYLVDFWGAGFDVAERMGIVPELRRHGYVMAEARAVGRDGRLIASIEPSAIMGSTDRYVTIARSDLAAAIYDSLEGRVRADLG